ncbi:hypothetical protein [Tahibacter amnicola]|uniref:Lipoprotein n=1 Tax=Tahibacter amnicola TaxID=2976241 RepID=A0ABY6BGB2_9GAMM|nr:hypothetical protein [Tahibacter amnicola]UXI69066.1 hypothetical protein N4264_05285 [Tahibacter amnicola]
MIRVPIRWLLIPAVLTLAACSDGGKPAAAPPGAAQLQAQQLAVQAAEKLKMYEQLRTTERYDLAEGIGSDIVKRFPGTPAADEVQKTLPALKERAAALAESRRIARLWTYNQVKEGKGTQYTAYVFAQGSPEQEGPDRVRLVLRQHPEWGQSVYLLRDEGGFTCGRDCSVSVRFDDQPAERMPATIPPTGEPAMFIDRDVAFIAKASKARHVFIDCEWKGKGKRTLDFEVAGLDLAKLPNPPKK